MEVIKVVTRLFLPAFILCGGTSTKQAAAGSIRNIEPVPCAAMYNHHFSLPVGECEREGYSLGAIVAAIQRQSNLSGLKVDDSTVAAVVVDNCRKLTV